MHVEQHLTPSIQRVPRVYFYTSNIDKYLQAKLIFASFGFRLDYFPGKRPYTENYALGSHFLLQEGLAEVLTVVGENQFVFIEDTTIRIEALSAPDSDVPGLAAKEWFAGTTFEELDSELRNRGNVRAATVKSDIALHVPGMKGPLFFHGETTGVVAGAPPKFQLHSASHPWLNPSTFNGWFVPEGATKPLGEMSIEEAWGFDFRIRSLTMLIKRLQEFTFVLNAPPTAYRLRSYPVTQVQLSLFGAEQPIFVAIGLPSAGKSYFGTYLSVKRNFIHIEASTVVRAARESTPIKGASIEQFGEHFHRRFGRDIVGRVLIETVDIDDTSAGLVISGLRHIEEFEALLSRFENATLVYIEARERTRFERFLARRRADMDNSFTSFLRRDEENKNFSLVRYGRQLATLVILNESGLDDYEDQLEFVASGRTVARPRGLRRTDLRRVALQQKLWFCCLEALHMAQRNMTSTELSSVVGRPGHNNASHVRRALRPMIPLMVEERRENTGLLHYGLTSTGASFVRVIRKLSA